MRPLLLLATLAFLFSPIIPVKAAGGAISPTISVNPSIIRESAKPGETKTFTLTLANLGTDPIPLSVTNINIAGISDIGTPELTNEVTPRSASDWVKLEKPDFILNATSKQEISVTVEVPKNTAPGGYSTALLFQAKLPSYYFDIDANARILPALSVSVLVSVGTDTLPTISDLKINSLSVPKVVVSGPVSLITEINNPTNYFIYANGELNVRSYGQNDRVTQLNGSVLMPDSSRKYISAYSGRILPGIYTATMELHQGDKTLIASARFVAVPWQFIVIVLTLLLAILAIKSRRRMKRAWAALASNDSGNKS